MKRYLAVIVLLIPVVASGCAGCSYTTGQLGGSGSQSITLDKDGAHPTNDYYYSNGQPWNMRDKDRGGSFGFTAP
jgi:hypothetical protein